MAGVLPKEVYAQLVPEEEPELLSNIVRILKDIPENCTVDIFGEIYEYLSTILKLEKITIKP